MEVHKANSTNWAKARHFFSSYVWLDISCQTQCSSHVFPTKTRDVHHTSGQHADVKVKNKISGNFPLCNVHLCRQSNEALTVLKTLIVLPSLNMCFCCLFQTLWQSRITASSSNDKGFPQTMMLKICLVFPHFKDSFIRGIEESPWHHTAWFLDCIKEGVKTHRTQISVIWAEIWRDLIAIAQWLWRNIGETIHTLVLCQSALVLSYIVFYAEQERIHCASDVELLTGCKCFSHVPKILSILQAAHCKILHFKCIELKRLWDYWEKLLMYCWTLNFTHLP